MIVLSIITYLRIWYSSDFVTLFVEMEHAFWKCWNALKVNVCLSLFQIQFAESPKVQWPIDQSGFSVEAEELAIRNSRFYARGRFEQKANEAGIPLWTVPAANEASTVLSLGCSRILLRFENSIQGTVTKYMKVP
jgi:hypothetical protein